IGTDAEVDHAAVQRRPGRARPAPDAVAADHRVGAEHIDRPIRPSGHVVPAALHVLPGRAGPAPDLVETVDDPGSARGVDRDHDAAARELEPAAAAALPDAVAAGHRVGAEHEDLAAARRGVVSGAGLLGPALHER